MPVETVIADSAGPDRPALCLRLTPHRPLTPEGFRWVILAAFGFMLIPLGAVLGSPMMWVILAFCMAALGLLWGMIRYHASASALIEEVVLTRDRLSVTHHAPRRPSLCWEANPYWTRLTIHDSGGPVERYLTLSGGGREIELGVFLSPDERVALCRDLETALSRLRDPGPDRNL